MKAEIWFRPTGSFSASFLSWLMAFFSFSSSVSTFFGFLAGFLGAAFFLAYLGAAFFFAGAFFAAVVFFTDLPAAALALTAFLTVSVESVAALVVA